MSGKQNFIRIKKFFFNSSQIKAPYDDLDTFPTNASAVYAVDASQVKNVATNSNAFTIKTWGINGNNSQSGTVQLFNSRDKGMYVRTSWGEGPTFTDWKQIKTGTPEENEFEYAKPSLAMFGKFGVVGDSYASGVLEDYSHLNKDVFASMTPEMTDNLSWPVMLSKKWGTSMLHLAKGGLSTRTWLTDDQGLKKLNESDPQDIYYLCLGINDYFGLGDSYLGIESDIESGADSFYGNYGKIIKAIQRKLHLPKSLCLESRLLLVTVTIDNNVFPMRNIKLHNILEYLISQKTMTSYLARITILNLWDLVTQVRTSMEQWQKRLKD